MKKTFKRPRRQKKTMASTILPIVCITFLGSAIYINSVSNKYEIKITYLKSEINSTSKKTTELLNKNKEIEDSISKLNNLIEDVSRELN